MKNEDEVDPIKVRTGLFALITARLEDAHEIAVKGQSTWVSKRQGSNQISDIESLLEEIEILISAIRMR
ncbi:hypothetical protein GCM10009096_01550 [Parasphingorhabdus litoris]|uniref:Transposase n=1 Tax=Parasphingorhabdus litoris TaxID=394733 RepID=A0ABN1A0P0_9SPHN|nr:hypothetical protein [Parasphingorhabdus litoris]